MEIHEAIETVKLRFPFAGYMSPGISEKSSYENIARTVVRHIPSSGRILDFGCGPCDTTAILQLLGFQCSGYDDLRHYWHELPGNREAIIAFASQSGIELHVADGSTMTFERHSFEMVMLHDVLEHLHDSPRELLNDLFELVVPGGLLFVTVPNAVNVRKRISVAFGRTNLPSYEQYYWYPGHFRGAREGVCTG